MKQSPAPDQRDLLKQARRTSLMKVWATGSRRLSADEKAEIADLIAPEAGATSQDSSPEPPSLMTEPSSPELTTAQLDELAAAYEIKRRQLYRYITLGVETNDPCPLADAGLFVLWWQRRMKHRVPPAILAAAARQKAAEAPPQAAAVGTAPQIPGAPSAADNVPRGVSVNLSESNLEEGEEVRQARQLLSGVFTKLEKAYALGDDDQIRMWQPRWEKASTAFAKSKAADDADRKRRGLLVNRADVQADIDEAIDMLKMMRESMDRRVREKLPDIDPSLLARISEAILEVRAKEDLVFLGLASMKSTAEMQALLAA
jgi:hypothetical protein